MNVKFYRFVTSLWMCSLVAVAGYAQSIVSGQVTSSEDGSSLPGVNVIVKGTSSGTVTDIDGNYRLNVPQGGTILTFSFIGYQSQDIDIGNQSTISLQLVPDTKQLSEVVVTAIGIERDERALGYSVENLQGEQIQQVSDWRILIQNTLSRAAFDDDTEVREGNELISSGRLV